ncbi:MAG: hypothetical protein ACKO2N_17825 [Tabrizicola sp.]
MNGMLWAIGGGTVILAGVMSYAVTRRYGLAPAVALPVAALAALVAMTWQDLGLNFSGGIGLLRETLVFVAPVLGGAAIGIALAWKRRA